MYHWPKSGLDSKNPDNEDTHGCLQNINFHGAPNLDGCDYHGQKDANDLYREVD